MCLLSLFCTLLDSSHSLLFFPPHKMPLKHAQQSYKGVLKRPKWLSIFWGNKMSFHGFSCWISKQFVCVKVIKDG